MCTAVQHVCIRATAVGVLVLYTLSRTAEIGRCLLIEVLVRCEWLCRCNTSINSTAVDASNFKAEL